MREWNAFKYLEMSIFRNDAVRISRYGTIHKFVVIHVGCYQIEFVIRRYKLDVFRKQNRGYDIRCYMIAHFTGQNFQILFDNFIGNTQNKTIFHKTIPHNTVWAYFWNTHKQTVGIKHNVSH